LASPVGVWGVLGEELTRPQVKTLLSSHGAVAAEL
ncbi:MAG: hypothetical protein ACI8W3_003030, partial [Myxococcota bacterium]